MTVDKLIKALPAPTKPEEVLIYNFICGKKVYQEQTLTTKDLYLQALLAFLEMKLKNPEPLEMPKRATRKSKE